MKTNDFFLVRVHLQELEDQGKENSLLKEEIIKQNITKEQEVNIETTKPKSQAESEDQNIPN